MELHYSLTLNPVEKLASKPRRLSHLQLSRTETILHGPASAFPMDAEGWNSTPHACVASTWLSHLPDSALDSLEMKSSMSHFYLSSSVCFLSCFPMSKRLTYILHVAAVWSCLWISHPVVCLHHSQCHSWGTLVLCLGFILTGVVKPWTVCILQLWTGFTF